MVALADTTFAADELASAGVRYVVLLGLGGSSLAPELLARTLSPAGFPELRLLDSTNPAQIRSVELGVDLERTLFVVSSSPEAVILRHYFFARLEARLGGRAAAARFVVAEAPGSALGWAA